jgi:hypothetical protein
LAIADKDADVGCSRDREQPICFIGPGDDRFNNLFASGVGRGHCGWLLVVSIKCEALEKSCQSFTPIRYDQANRAKFYGLLNPEQCLMNVVSPTS